MSTYFSQQRAGVKYNFVVGCDDARLAFYDLLSDAAEQARIDQGFAADLASNGETIWCLQGFLLLRARGTLAVQLSNRLRADAINIIHSDRLLSLRGAPSTFIVCVRADYPKRGWAHYQLVQNRSQLTSNTSLIPHWVQPGLIARDPERRHVRRIAYVGHTYNGNLAGDVDGWRRHFASHGLDFVTPPQRLWHDMSSFDVMIGIRSFDRNPHDTKPPSKLFNAWHARIPFIGGHDSAFMQVGMPGEDYLLAATPEEAVAAVLRLRDDPTLYDRLVRNGAAKASQFTEQTISQAWEQALTGPIMRRYQAWRSSPSYERARFKAMLAAGLMEHGAKQRLKRLATGRAA